MTILSPQPAPHILVFDSGVGGLSISREIRLSRPDLHQTYLADDAFRPYGEKTEAQLRHRLPDLLAPICDMLQPDIVVIACNTASTTALPSIRAALTVPVVGVVPAIKPAAALSENRAMAVLGTPGTVRRRYVDSLIEEFASDCSVRLQGSVALVEEAEAKLSGRPVNTERIKEAIAPLFAGKEGEKVDAIVLACTHFPLLRDELHAAAPRPIQWIDSGEAVARRVDSLLSDVRNPRGYPPALATAFLTGPDDNPVRRDTFAAYGFKKLVSLQSS